jgi:hypothetical protein
MTDELTDRELDRLDKRRELEKCDDEALIEIIDFCEATLEDAYEILDLRQGRIRGH